MGRFSPWWATVGYIAVLLLVFGGALWPGANTLIFGDDIHRAYYFYRQFFNEFLKEGIWPWWNPYNFAGSPFMAHPIVNIWYPPTWLFVLLPLNVAYSWHLALHLLWAMMGMFVLLSSRGRSPWATDRGDLIEIASSQDAPRNDNLPAWVAGLVFGLSGFFTARIWAGHVDVIAAASWMPWVVAAFSNQLSAFSRKHCVLAGLALAMQLLAGYQTMALFTLEVVAVFLGISLIARRASLAMVIATIARVSLSTVLAIGLFAAVLIPQQEFFRQTIRTYAFPYSWNAYGSLEWKSLGQFLNPFLFGDQVAYHGPPPNFAEHAFFVGRIGLLVAIIGSVIALRKASVWLLFFCFTALLGLWVSLGPNAPIDLQYILWKLVPMYKYLRIPPRHLILVVFGLSGLVGIAMRALRSARLSLMLAGFITIEMVLYARHFISLKPIPETRHDGELIRILKQDREPFRVLPNFGAWIPPRDSFDFDAAMSYRIFSGTGYDTMILRHYYEFIDAANGRDKPSILEHDVQVPYLNVFSPATDFLNIKYILVPRAYDPLGGASGPFGKTQGKQAARRFRLIREDIARDYRLYENTTVLPRFFFENNKEGKVEIEKYGPNEIVLTVDTPKDETLMSSEAFYPGWEGFVDGQKVDIIKTNHAFRALFVPAGRHTVTYRYRPTIFALGGFVSVGTMIAIAYWLRRT